MEIARIFDNSDEQPSQQAQLPGGVVVAHVALNHEARVRFLARQPHFPHTNPTAAPTA